MHTVVLVVIIAQMILIPGCLSHTTNYSLSLSLTLQFSAALSDAFLPRSLCILSHWLLCLIIIIKLIVLRPAF